MYLIVVSPFSWIKTRKMIKFTMHFLTTKLVNKFFFCISPVLYVKLHVISVMQSFFFVPALSFFLLPTILLSKSFILVSKRILAALKK